MPRKVSRDLVHRWEGNPVITVEDFPFPVSDICNAGAIKIDGEYILLVTIENLEGYYSIYPARSRDGYYFSVSSSPFLTPAMSGAFAEYENLGTLDPRITKMDGVYYVTYNAVSNHGVMLGLATTEDFKSALRLHIMSEPDTKAGVLFPRKIKGKYARLERPGNGSSIWVSYSDDLQYWGHSEVIMTPRGGFWDNNRIGPGTPLFEVEEGWLFVYYGIKETSSGPLFRLGVALLDREEPTTVVGRSNIPILAPRENYERIGDVPNVVYSCGGIIEDNGQMRLYYGASNSCVCVGTVLVNELIERCLESQKEF